MLPVTFDNKPTAVLGGEHTGELMTSEPTIFERLHQISDLLMFNADGDRRIADAPADERDIGKLQGRWLDWQSGFGQRRDEVIRPGAGVNEEHDAPRGLSSAVCRYRHQYQTSRQFVGL